MIIGSATANIDDNLKKADDANDAAAVANNGVKDINSDNKLTPNEKLSLKRLYDSDVLKHDFDVKQLTSMSLPTADIDLALSNLTSFTAKYFVNMDITEEVDRQALNKVFNNFENADKAVEGLFNDAVQQVADDAKTAGEEAKEAGEKAQEVGEEAKASANQAKTDATQAKTDAATAQQKAQSSIDQLDAHLPDIDEALSTANLVKQNVTKLSDTTEQYHNEYTTGIQNVIKTIDDITVGGTNLIKNSSSDVVIDDTVNKQGWAHSTIYSELEAGQEYTFTSSVTVNAGKVDEMCVNVLNPNTGETTLVSNRPVVNGKIEYTFTAVKDFPQLLVYAGTPSGTKGNKVTLHHYQLEKGNKATDWAPAPEDFATSTEIDQINNAIKLKADSTDVASQINVAVKGVQTDVTNKVSSLTTQINQTSDAVQILATTSGQKNLVYNSSYANSAEGWNMFNGVGYLSTVPASSYNGSPGFSVNVSGKGASDWTKFGQSKLYTLPSVEVSEDNTYSANAMIKISADSDSTAKLSASLTYYDKNGVRISGWKDMFVSYDSKNVWTEVKFENLPVPDGAVYVGMQYWAYGSKVHGMIAQPMIVFGPKIGTYNPDTVSQSDITASINNIHMGIKGADGSTSTFNMNNNTILLDANKIIINGNTSIQNGTIGTAKIANAAINTAQIADGAINNAKIANASIDDAKISNLNGNKIIARSITSEQLNADDIIANVINGKTINGITINTPNLQLGTNGTLTENWTLNQATSLFNPKKGSGTMTLTQGLLATSGTLSRWWSDDGGYWYGIGDDGSKIKNGSNQVGDNYGAGYAQHNIFDSKGNTLLRTYMDATGLYMNSGGTSNVNTVLTQQGLTTANVTALGDINGATLTTSSWVEAGIGSGNGIRIGFRTIQSHNTQDLYFNGDDNKQSVTLHAKSIIQSSQLSRKKDIKPLDPDYAMKVIRNSDMYGYRYNEESPTEPFHYSGIIDDVNGIPQFKMPEEFISEDRTGRNDGNTVAFLVEALKQADKRIGILEGMMNSD
ncbi:hypothetical protein [Pediococcus pentosaceus]|uniref:hypothetical protein n=1 Tax=Pediococcus pentosaceus TaxID=1255 RepID=UPI0021E75A4A|nr:hypothetical protein [Pediococcus pentosaceus]MCV3330514.1 hypothetical protein [Pediococcus pentosaceus]